MNISKLQKRTERTLVLAGDDYSLEMMAYMLDCPDETIDSNFAYYADSPYTCSHGHKHQKITTRLRIISDGSKLFVILIVHDIYNIPVDIATIEIPETTALYLRNMVKFISKRVTQADWKEYAA